MEGLDLRQASKLVRDFAKEHGIKTGKFTFVGKRVIVWNSRNKAEIPDLGLLAEYRRTYPATRPARRRIPTPPPTESESEVTP